MTVSAPGDNPRVGGDPRDYPGLDPGMWARVRDWAGAFNPIGSAQAAEAPASNPFSDAFGGAFKHIHDYIAAHQAATNPPAVPVPPVPGHPLAGPATGPAGPIVGGSVVGAPPIAQHPLQGPGTGPAGPITANGSVVGAPPIGAPAPVAPAPETQRMPYPGQIDPRGVFAPAQPGVTGAAVGAPPPSQNPFVLTYRPNADVAGGALSRGGPPSMTALNLSGLFGGRAAAAPMPVTAPKKSVRVTRPDSDAPLPPKRPKEKFRASTTSQGGGYNQFQG